MEGENYLSAKRSKTNHGIPQGVRGFSQKKIQWVFLKNTTKKIGDEKIFLKNHLLISGIFLHIHFVNHMIKPMSIYFLYTL